MSRREERAVVRPVRDEGDGMDGVMAGGGRTLPLPRRQSLVTAAWDDMARRVEGFRSGVVRRISVVRWDPPRYAAAFWHAGDVGWICAYDVVRRPLQGRASRGR